MIDFRRDLPHHESGYHWVSVIINSYLTQTFTGEAWLVAFNTSIGSNPQSPYRNHPPLNLFLSATSPIQTSSLMEVYLNTEVSLMGSQLNGGPLSHQYKDAGLLPGQRVATTIYINS